MNKIAIIDQQQIFREGLHRLIEAEEDMEVVASENLFSELDDETIEQVDVFLVDVDILAKEHQLIKEKVLDMKKDGQKVIVISSESKEIDIKEIILTGYHGFLLQEMSF
ncbi:MAG: response regulator transcription factor, partial [Bacilli bacterium]|nr:response regulator transcription factor [Bacilli bacterium]